MAKPITIPSLTIDAEYADLTNRIATVNGCLAEGRREAEAVESAIAAEAQTEGPRLRAPIAVLVGDADIAGIERRKRLRELRLKSSDYEEAIGELLHRLERRRSAASRAVIAAVQGEINKRVGAVVDATEAALMAQDDLESLIRAIEAEGVETDSLRGNIMPFFLTTGQAARYVAAHRGAANG